MLYLSLSFPLRFHTVSFLSVIRMLTTYLLCDDRALSVIDLNQATTTTALPPR